MSFSRAINNATTGNLSGFFQTVVLSGSTAIAGSGDNGGFSGSGSGNGVWYSSNSGANWTQSSLSGGIYPALALSGTNAIASGYEIQPSPFVITTLPLSYSTNSGQTWTSSNITGLVFNSLVLSSDGTKGIAGCSNISPSGIYYSTNSGQTWTASNITSGIFNTISLFGSNAIAGSQGNGIYYSTNSGQTWTQSNITTGNITSLIISGTNAISNFSAAGIYYSTDSGQNWTISATNFFGTIFNTVFLSGANGVAGGGTNGIWFSTNSGVTWSQSNITTGAFQSIALSGTIGIASSTGGGPSSGIYTGSNSGANWSQSNITATNISAVAISGTNGIAGSNANLGIYYNITTLCYEKNTLILVLENEVELYKKICELKVGDTVKTYKHGYKNIKLIDSFHYNPSYTKRNKRLLYKMIGYDVIVTGKHGILVDELTEQEIFNTKMSGTTIRYIDDKKVLPACASDKFEKVIDDKDFELWHFVLENDDINKCYGIYINDGILSESCSEDCFRI